MSAQAPKSIMETYAYKPEYSREQLKKLMGEILKLKISDADFFGIYKDNTWLNVPMLDYSYNNSALSVVEEAAKAGDYKLAAEALLEYYKARQPLPLKYKPDCNVTPIDKKTVDWKQGDQAQASMALSRKYLPNALKVFKKEDCTPRECVEYLKGVVLLGMQWSNGYCPLQNINGLGGNWIPWHSHDAIVSLPALPELSDCNRWIAKSFEYLENHLKYIVYDDGSYIEHTFGYPRKILPLMINLREIFLDHGLPLSDQFGIKTQRMARYLMFTALPNGQGVEWGEGHLGDSRIRLAGAASYFNDPELTWWTSKGKKGVQPKVKDVHFPFSKNLVFRSSWGEDANYLFFAPRAGGSHFHTDQNMIELIAFGQRFLRDTGMCTYSAKDPSFHFLRHMNRSHNTVEVDKKGFSRENLEKNTIDQEAPSGSEVYSSPKAGFAKGWAEGYSHVRHERTVFFIKETAMTVVFDALIPDDNEFHTYDQCWHLDPSNNFESDEKTGRVWTNNLHSANMDMIPVYPKKSELLLRMGWNMHPRTRTVYPSYRQTTAGPAEFVTLIHATPKKSRRGAVIDWPRKVNAEVINRGNSGVSAIQIETPKGKGILIYSRSLEPVTAGDIQTNAECAYIQFNKKGEIDWAVQQGGNQLTFQGKEVNAELMEYVSYPSLASYAE